MPKYRVGDKVKIVKQNWSIGKEFGNGEIVVLKKEYQDGAWVVSDLDDFRHQVLFEHNFELYESIRFSRKKIRWELKKISSDMMIHFGFLSGAEYFSEKLLSLIKRI